MTASRPLPPSTICVVDSDCLIGLKRTVKLDDQWDYFQVLTELVEAGYLAFPRQVVHEVRGVQYPDTPGAWMARNRNSCRYPQPSDDALAEVMSLLAPGPGTLVDVNAPLDKADPYIVAMAYDLRSRYKNVRVLLATEDAKDRQAQMSPATACGRLGIERVDLTGFDLWVQGAHEDLHGESPGH